MEHLENPIAALNVSPARRVFGALIQAALGGLLVVVALSMPEGGLFSRLFLVALGGVFLWQGYAYYKATEAALILTEHGLFESNGETIIALKNIDKVDRGFFAFKPSNGFLIVGKEGMARTWKPGLYWRFGRRIGVGGATSGKAARDFADVIAILLTDRGAELIAQARKSTSS